MLSSFLSVGDRVTGVAVGRAGLSGLRSADAGSSRPAFRGDRKSAFRSAGSHFADGRPVGSIVCVSRALVGDWPRDGSGIDAAGPGGGVAEFGGTLRLPRAGISDQTRPLNAGSLGFRDPAPERTRSGP